MRQRARWHDKLAIVIELDLERTDQLLKDRQRIAGPDLLENRQASARIHYIDPFTLRKSDYLISVMWCAAYLALYVNLGIQDRRVLGLPLVKLSRPHRVRRDILFGSRIIR